MSNLSVNTITDASGGSTASINGLTPQASNMQPHNLIINGAMTVAQRGTSASGVTDNGYHTLDRWRLIASGATLNTSQQEFTLGQTDVPSQFKYFQRIEVTTGDNNAGVDYRIEDVTTISGETVTLSFYAKGTNPAGGNMDLHCTQNFGSGGSTAVTTLIDTYVLTSSWQRFTFTFTIPSISGKTVGTSSFIQIDNRQPDADTGTAAWTLDFTGVQLEAGSNASSFAHESYADTLQKCQRYYYRLDNLSINAAIGTGYNQSTTNSLVYIAFPSSMRDTPSSLETTGTAGEYDVLNVGTVNINTAVPYFQNTTLWGGYMNWEKSTGGKVAGQGCIGRMRSGTNSFLAWSAEL